MDLLTPGHPQIDVSQPCRPKHPRAHSLHRSPDTTKEHAPSLDCAQTLALVDRLAHERDPQGKSEAHLLLKRSLCEADRKQRQGQSVVRERLMGIHRRAEAAEENQIEMEQRNEAAREVIQGVRQDGRYSEGQEAVEAFYRGWLAEAQQVQQDDKYYTLD